MEFSMNLLQMSFAGAVMIAVIIIIRTFTLNRLPKKTFLALWGIVLLRLLIPFTVPSKLSIYSFLEKNIKNSTNTTNVIPSLIQRTMANPTALTTFPVFSENAAHKAFSPLEIIWVSGAFACLLFFIISYRKCRKAFAVSIPVQNEFTYRWLHQHNLKRMIEIRQSGFIKAPLTYGLFHPIILMPANTEWENQKQTQYVLLHEFIHIKRFDILTKSILITALCIHWFNPFVWFMFLLCNRDMELSCDETVVRTLGLSARADYAKALIYMEETKSGFMPLCNNFSKNAIEGRITAIMKTKNVKIITIISAALLVLGILIVFATSKVKSINAAQETIVLEKIGLTLILPDSWKNQYAVEEAEDSPGNYIIYNPTIREAWDKEYGGGNEAGCLFYILKWHQAVTEEQALNEDGEWNYTGNRYIMTVDDGTYFLYYTSDIQYTEETKELYRQLTSQIPDIRFAVSQ